MAFKMKGFPKIYNTPVKQVGLGAPGTGPGTGGGTMDPLPAAAPLGTTPMIKSPMKQQQPHEGKKTISGDRLIELDNVKNKPDNIDGSADYYYTGDVKTGITIHGEVDLEGGAVTGVPGNVPGKVTRAQ